MSNLTYENFRVAVEEYLIRHKSILDIMTKIQESSSRVNRALAKTVTECGCMEINAKRQTFPEDVSLSDLRKFMDSQIYGDLCQDCKETLEREIGQLFFYLTALCSVLGLDINEIIQKNFQRINTLGIFNLT